MIAFVVRLKSRAHFIIQRSPLRGREGVLGAAARRRVDTRMRLGILIAVFIAIYAVVAARLVQYGLADPVATAWVNTGATAVASRPDIVDRNGKLLATDLNMVSLYADPRRVVAASYTHLRAHETVLDLVCRLLLEKKKPQG